MGRRARSWYRSVGYDALFTARRLSGRRRILPDFVVIGAQKAGTSTLSARLFAHPQVLAPLRREVHYFDLAHRRSTAWYRAHFPTARRRDEVARTYGRAITGESSPYYLFHPAVPARLHAVLPDVPLVAILREPVERAVSEYHHAVRLGLERRPIEVALDCGRRMVDDLPAGLVPWDDADAWPRRHSYVERGHYADQLARWFEVVGRERVLIVATDGLRDGRALREAQRFLALDDHPHQEEIVRNVNEYDDAPAPLLDRLVAHYAPHNERLRALLGSLPWSDRPAAHRSAADGSVADESGAVTRAAGSAAP